MCVYTADLIETLEIKASIRVDELVASHPTTAACLTTLLHSLGNEVNHVKNGSKDWRHLWKTISISIPPVTSRSYFLETSMFITRSFYDLQL